MVLRRRSGLARDGPRDDRAAPETATQVLEDAGFEVAPAGAPHDPRSRPGRSSDRSVRRAGARLTVQLFVSLGPQLLDVPQVVGAREADARPRLRRSPWPTIGRAVLRRRSGTVTAALDANGARWAPPTQSAAA